MSRADRILSILESHVSRGYASGMVALVAHGDERNVYAAGTQALGVDAPMRRDTIFRIASMTKAITAAAAMMLAEDGTFHLDDPVDAFLPELANRRVLTRIDGELDDTVPATRAITVEDLLTFRNGFGILMMPPGRYPI